jgi:AraC family transcriptional regulator
MDTKGAYGIITEFPNFKKEQFDIESYNRQFREKNIIIHAKSKQVSYPLHWGPLSIKTAFNGTEYYKVNNCDLAVHDHNYLVVNNGNVYSSYIDSDHLVESFTINFATSLVLDSTTSCLFQPEHLLEGNVSPNAEKEFYEKLNQHDVSVSPFVFKLLELSKNFDANLLKIEEAYILLLEQLILKQKESDPEIQKIQALKLSTKKELYKRLTRARDYIDSCYQKDITLANLASVCFMNQTYFLRQFRRYFGITPRQYVIKKRMEKAKACFDLRKDVSVTEVCLQVGYNDLSSFSKLFKTFYACSPKNYQKKQA